MAGTMDRLDRKLLSCLQVDNLQTADRLAEQVGRSASAVARRLRRLRATGAIAADVAVLSEAAAGFPLSAVVYVQLESHRPSDFKAVHRRLLTSPHTQLFLDVTGAFDILLLVVARDIATFTDFCEEMLEVPGVQRYETSFVKKRHKASLAMPMDSADP